MAPVKKKVFKVIKKKKRYSKFKSVNLAPSREWHMNWSPTHVDDPDCIDILSLHSYRETEKNWSHRTTRSSKKNGDETAGLWRMPLPKNIANPERKKLMYMGKYILYFLVETPGLGSIEFGWT